MISKCIDMISILCNTHSDQIQTVVNQSDILNFMLTLIAVILFLNQVKQL